MRTIVVIFSTIAVTIYLGGFIILVSLLGWDARRIHKIASIWANFILLAGGVRVHVRGARNIENLDRCIVMANHVSLYDIPVLLGNLKVPFKWLAKAELFRIPVFGTAMKSAGYISIDRSNRESAFRSLHQAAQTIRNGAAVMIFPEGTRSSEGNLLPFKKGGFVLAVESGVPVVPVVVHGTKDIMQKKTLRIRGGRDVFLDILPTIDASRFTRKTKDQLLERVWEKMSGCLDAEKGISSWR